MQRAQDIDKLIDAQKEIVKALEPLDSSSRNSVLKAALTLLGEKGIQENIPGQAPESTPAESPVADKGFTPDVHQDIRSLEEQKNPRSNNEMAALVAYYLSEVANEEEKKDSIGTDEIIKYFKQAGYKLPQQPKQTLINAKHAGYFDSAGKGRYKLNPVGFNLVVHNLPLKKEAAIREPAKKKNKKRRNINAKKKKAAK